MKALMLVSAFVDGGLRRAVAAGRRPAPEFLKLEHDFGVELLDWSQIGALSGHRSVSRSVRHAAKALQRIAAADVVLSDGEHLAFPLVLAMRGRGIRTPHVTIGHHLLTPAKIRLLRSGTLARGMDRVLVHSSNQLEEIAATTAISSTQLAVVPYGIDTTFWSGSRQTEEGDLVVSAGREHRDYRTLVGSLPEGARLEIADHSLFTPQATRRDPEVWPSHVKRLALDPQGLRDLYDRSAVVAVPVLDTTMPAGITTLLEAMAMGKAVVVTETAELRGVVEHGATGLAVPPGDEVALRDAIGELLASRALRERLGRNAREAAVERHDVGVYARTLFGHLVALASRGPATLTALPETGGRL